ncbi:hypothetical protein [Arcticibacter tournemirensis]|uniref:Uncharacterized protein n=1 Tax=Arcticibacter tournemirensis TaxID=699437 RepID=A0A4Q0MDX3_9SPHI|nr:hypothetical protein [Arcticibacter tournemirensis]RXF71006.1 hypothetical protein EKH83_04660 [Arcticibacter tournemirensis]
MEYLPFVIGIIIAAYKLYSNFQEEQEKARKRNPSLPTKQSEADETSNPQKKQVSEPRPSMPPHRPVVSWPQSPSIPAPKPQAKPEPVLVREATNPQRPYEPVYTRDYSEPVYEKPVLPKRSGLEKTVTPTRVELTHFEDISDETVKNRNIHAPHKHGMNPLTHEDQDVHFEFDMRHAIIQQAILNRPEY